MVMPAKRFDALARPSGSFGAPQLRTLAANAPDAVACLLALEQGALGNANDWFPRFTNRRHGRFVKASSGQSSCVRPSSSGVSCPSCGGQRADWFGALRSKKGLLAVQRLFKLAASEGGVPGGSNAQSAIEALAPNLALQRTGCAVR